MKGKRKNRKIPGFMRHIVAENVRGLMDLRFRESRNRPKALSEATGPAGEGRLSLSTVQRILDEETGASLDNLEAIADALDVSLYQLLIPALDVGNPQIVQGAVKNEERMYKQWRRGAVDTGKFAAIPASERQTSTAKGTTHER